LCYASIKCSLNAAFKTEQPNCTFDEALAYGTFCVFACFEFWIFCEVDHTFAKSAYVSIFWNVDAV